MPLGATTVGEMTVKNIDSVTDYAELMAQLFDFEKISALFASGFYHAF
jgi:phosphoglucomutase